MCNILKELKFCSCGDKDITNLDNYWVLSKYKKDYMIIGEAPSFYGYFKSKYAQENDLLTADFNEKKQLLIKYVEDLLLEFLNNNDELFDFTYLPMLGDQLEVWLNIDKERGIKAKYHFRYRLNRVWDTFESDWPANSNHEQTNQGIVKVPGLER